MTSNRKVIGKIGHRGIIITYVIRVGSNFILDNVLNWTRARLLATNGLFLYKSS